MVETCCVFLPATGCGQDRMWNHMWMQCFESRSRLSTHPLVCRVMTAATILGVSTSHRNTSGASGAQGGVFALCLCVCLFALGCVSFPVLCVSSLPLTLSGGVLQRGLSPLVRQCGSRISQDELRFDFYVPPGRHVVVFQLWSCLASYALLHPLRMQNVSRVMRTLL
jgi:hypothetical protein